MIDYKNLDIIYMTKMIPDYLHDAIFLGLNELGCNVIDYPRKDTLHGTPPPSIYHPNQLYLNLPENNLKKTNPDLLIISALMHDIKPMGNEEWKFYVYSTYKKFKPKKIIIIDGQDQNKAIYPTLDQDYNLIFKREIFYLPYNNWHQISFAAIPETFCFKYYPYREYDISCMLGISVMYRLNFCQKLRELCKKIGLKSYIHIDKQTLPREKYLEILSNSRVSFSVRGMGLDCYRYWEIPSKGTVLATEDIKLPFTNNFTDDMYFKFNTNLEDLEEVLVNIKNMKYEELQEMGIKSLNHSLYYHTPRIRAKWILDKIGF